MRGYDHLSDSTAIGEEKAIETVKSDDLTVVTMAGRLLGGNGSKSSSEWLHDGLKGDAQVSTVTQNVTGRNARARKGKKWAQRQSQWRPGKTD